LFSAPVSAVAPGTAIAVSTAASTTGLAGASLVHGETAATDVAAVELLDGTTSIVVAHLHEPEAAGATGVTIGHDLRRLHGSMRREHARKVVG
jgi:hypothetical protein